MSLQPRLGYKTPICWPDTLTTDTVTLYNHVLIVTAISAKKTDLKYFHVGADGNIGLPHQKWGINLNTLSVGEINFRQNPTDCTESN